MKKMFKRTTAIAASALMIGQMVPFNVFAEPATVPPSKLTIHPYIVTDETMKGLHSPDDDATGRTTDRDRADAKGDPVAGVMSFSVVKVTDEGDVIEGAGAYSQSVTSNTTLEDIPEGYYRITPTNTTTDVNFRDVESFFLHLPAVADGSPNYNVHVYPKMTNNVDTDNNSKDPETETDPATDPKTTPNKHSIKLKKQLSGSDTWTSGLSATFNIYYKDALGNWINAGDFETDDNGVIQIDGLPLGTYYAVETQAPEGYLLDQDPIVFKVDGNGKIDDLVKEFVNDKELKVKKEVVTSGDHSGDTYKWQITADIPTKEDKLISYSVTDTYTNQKSVAIESVKVGNDTLVAGDDYEVVPGDGTVTINVENLDALTGDKLIITVSSVVKDDYDLNDDGSVTNGSSIAYRYAFNPPDDDNTTGGDVIPDDIPDPDDTNPDDDVPEKNYPGSETDPDTHDEFKPATIIISNVDATDTTKELTHGSYEITRCSTHDDDTTTNVVRLENLAPGKYTIKQLSTQAGYYFIEGTSKTIFIDKEGKVYEGSEADPEKLISDNKIVFYDFATLSGFQLPFTGSTATIVFTIAGIGVMGGALFFFIFFKKRDKDEEEQENA